MRTWTSGGIVLTVLLALAGTNLCAQSFTTAVGLRLGGTSGLTIKHQYKPAMAVEGIIGGFPNGFSVTGLIEKSAPAFQEKGLTWYYGGGAHVAAYNGRYYYSRFGRDIDYRASNDVGFGINGIVGIEYRLPDHVPVAFSLDLKPFIEFSTGGRVGMAADPSLGVKFIIR